MIVQAPDNKTIDFGNLPPDQVQSAMQRLYPVNQQSALTVNQQTANNGGDTDNSWIDKYVVPLGQGAQAGLEGLGSVYDLARMPFNAMGANIPSATDIIRSHSSLPPPNGLASDLTRGTTSALASLGLGAGLAEAGSPLVAGVGQALTSNPVSQVGAFAGSEGARGIAQRSGAGPIGQLAAGFGGALAGGKIGGFADAMATDPQAVGNQLIKYLGEPSPHGDIEDEAINQLMTPEAGSQPGSALKAGFGARSPEEYQDAASAVSGAANPIWKQMREAGDALTPDASNGLMDNITQNLSSPENKYIPQLNPKTTAIIEDMKTEAENGSLGVSTLDQYRRMLSRVGGSEDGFSAGVAKRTIDKYLAEIPDDALVSGNKDSIDLLNQARAQSAAGFKAQDVADLLSKANGDPNKIKSVLTKFVSDDDNLIGMSQQQKDALRFAANTGIGENVLKAFGKFGLDFSKSGVGNTALPALAAMAGHAPLAIVGTLARQGQKYIARGKAEQAFRLFEKGGQQ